MKRAVKRAPQAAAKPVKWAWLTSTVLAIGLVSLLTDVSGEMMVAYLPDFIMTVLGGGALWVGLMDGSAEFVSNALPVFAGHWVDRTGKRKPLVLFGYGLSGLLRPLMAFATVPWHAVAVRVSDRVGKGLRSSPRDHLLAQEATPQTQGRVFSFHRAMDHTGAVLGTLVGVILIKVFEGDVRKVFLWAAVPGVLALLAVLIGVIEKPVPQPKSKEKPEPWSWLPPKELRPLFVALAAFGLGASTDMFLLVKAKQSNAPLISLPLLWMALSFIKANSSLLGGSLADRWGARTTVAIGWGVYTLVYAGLAFTSNLPLVMGLFVVYGIYHGLTEGPEKALVSQLAKSSQRGLAFGWYSLVYGLLAVPASLLFGLLYDKVSPQAAFLSGSGFALLGLVLLYALPIFPAKGRARA
jgi:MFS family permease